MSPEPAELAELAGRIAASARQLAEAAASADEPRLNAVRLASELTALSAAAQRLAVEQARSAGHTWQELGDLLGVSRQAAFQRFGRPVDPRTGELMSNAILPGAAARATDLLIDWFEGRYDQVIRHFDATMTQELPADGLAEGWAKILGSVGAYERMGEPLVRQLGDHTVVDIPLSFEASEMKGRVALDKQGKVAGLFVLPVELP